MRADNLAVRLALGLPSFLWLTGTLIVTIAVRTSGFDAGRCRQLDASLLARTRSLALWPRREVVRAQTDE